MPGNEYFDPAHPISTPVTSIFTPTPDGIRFGLAAIKNVGATAIGSIAERKPFHSVLDFSERVDLKNGQQNELWKA